jgi:hypothetical protein
MEELGGKRRHGVTGAQAVQCLEDYSVGVHSPDSCLGCELLVPSQGSQSILELIGRS